jgi:Zn-dependent M32 family carboxypeptidase
MNKSYQTLQDHFRDIYILRDVDGIMNWDMEVIMPEGSAKARGD